MESRTDGPRPRLPAIMRERLVGIGHTVGILPSLDCYTAIIGGIEKLTRKPLLHGVLRTAARARDQPADRQRLAAIGANLDWHLIGGAADPARPHLHGGSHVAERVVEHTERILAAALADAVEGAIHNPLRNRLFALVHQAVHEFGEDGITEFRIRQDLAFDRGA